MIMKAAQKKTAATGSFIADRGLLCQTLLQLY